MDALVVDLPTERETAALGARIGPLLAPGDVVCLSGPLGAGKTTLARGLIEALTGETEAPSPTYALVETYDATGFSIYHFDLYRLAEPAEIFELGIEEAFDGGVSLIEWPEIIENLVPESALLIRLEAANGGRRAFVTPRGRWVGQPKTNRGLRTAIDQTLFLQESTKRT